MPGVTAAMIDWWFAWHPMEDTRYKLWHPRAHLACRSERMNGDDEALSSREKYLNNSHYVTEYVGAEKLDIVITFSDPSNVLDVQRFKCADVGTAMCATVGMQHMPFDVTRMIHLIRETENGVEMRSRFWMGALAFKGREGLVPGNQWLARQFTRIELGRNLLVHCGMEMNHLAGFLPRLFELYHPE